MNPLINLIQTTSLKLDFYTAVWFFRVWAPQSSTVCYAMTQSSNHFFLFRLYMQLSLSQTLPHIVIWACGGWNIPFVIIFMSVLGATIKETPLDASTLLTHGIVGTGTLAASSFKAVTHRLQNMLPLNLFLNYYRNEFHLNWKLREVRAFVLLC